MLQNVKEFSESGKTHPRKLMFNPISLMKPKFTTSSLLQLDPWTF